MSEQTVPSFLETLIERLSSEEGLEVEFKSAKGGLPVSLWPTVSAFANTIGGWIVLGIDHDEQTGSVKIQGISNPSAMLLNFFNVTRNPQKVSIPVCGANDARIESLGGHQIIVIRVPATPRKFRPVYLNGNAYGGTYVRRHSGDYLCNKQEVDRMMREASDVAADSTILKHFSWDDLDLGTFARYRRQYQTYNASSPWNSYTDQEFLEAIKGYRRDREASEEGITVAGMLLLGKSEAIRDWRSRHLIDFRLMTDDIDSETRWEDRITWEGNLFDAYGAIYPRLIDGIPVPFRLQNGIRLGESDVHEALREALVNLLAHADYAETDASLVFRSPSGYFFRNPGSSRVLEADLLTGGRSDPRNPELVRMFRIVGLAEEAGTGIPKIMRTWREAGLQLPPIDVGTERYEFTINLRRAHLISEDDRSWLSSLRENWTEAEQLALVMAKNDGNVDNPRLRKVTGQHMYNATKTLGSLRDRQYLSVSQPGRTPQYELGPRCLVERNIVGLEVDSDANDLSSDGNREDLQDNEANLQDNGGDLQDNGGDLQDRWAMLQTLAAPVSSQQRLNAKIRNEVIVRLCAVAPLSVAELAQLLNRNIASVREAIPGLVASGQLDYLYPNNPTHPRQKYVALQRTLDLS